MTTSLTTRVGMWGNCPSALPSGHRHVTHLHPDGVQPLQYPEAQSLCKILWQRLRCRIPTLTQAKPGWGWHCGQCMCCNLRCRERHRQGVRIVHMCCPALVRGLNPCRPTHALPSSPTAPALSNHSRFAIRPATPPPSLSAPFSTRSTKSPQRGRFPGSLGGFLYRHNCGLGKVSLASAL